MYIYIYIHLFSRFCCSFRELLIQVLCKSSNLLRPQTLISSDITLPHFQKEPILSVSHRCDRLFWILFSLYTVPSLRD